MVLITFFQQHSHNKADCPEPRKMGACYNCGQEGWVITEVLVFSSFDKTNYDPVTPRPIVLSPARWVHASTAARKGKPLLDLFFSTLLVN